MMTGRLSAEQAREAMEPSFPSAVNRMGTREIIISTLRRAGIMLSAKPFSAGSRPSRHVIHFRRTTPSGGHVPINR